MLKCKTYLVALAIVFVAVSFASIAQTVPMLQKRGFSGDGTYYSPGLGACGGQSGAGSLIAALNKPQWGNPANPNTNPICGKQALVHGPKGSVTVTIVDLCPECLYGSLDLSPAAFNQIADQAAGRVPISWDWADAGPPPPPPPPAHTTTTPTPTPTPTKLVVTTTTSTSTSKTSTSTSSTPTPTPSKLKSIAFPFMNGKVPFLSPNVTLWDGSNPLQQTQDFLNGMLS